MGAFASDLTVVLSERRGRPDYSVLRAGLLRGYRAVRPLPAEHERYLEVFHGPRLLQPTLWFLEQRDRPLRSGRSPLGSRRSRRSHQELDFHRAARWAQASLPLPCSRRR